MNTDDAKVIAFMFGPPLLASIIGAAVGYLLPLGPFCILFIFGFIAGALSPKSSDWTILIKLSSAGLLAFLTLGKVTSLIVSALQQ